MKNIEDIVYGTHPILEILKSKKRKIYSIYTTEVKPKAFLQIQKLLPDYVKIHYVSKDMLNKMAQTTDHQSVVAKTSSFVFRSKFFDPKKDKFLLLIDGIQDPRNLGAILRSAYCVSVDGVIIPEKNSAPVNAVTLKSSAGLCENLQIYKSSNLKESIKELKKLSYNIYLAAFNGENAVQVNYKSPLCLVIGSEGKGISKDILSLGEIITLPQRDKDISYNASVAAGILLFNIAFQNKKI